MESVVTTQLRIRVTNMVGESYPDISFTNMSSDKTPTFPNVYIHELESAELGNTLENKSIRAIRENLQIEVATNTTKTDAKNVANACSLALKQMSFSLLSMPVYMRINNVHRFVIRAQRTVASGDNF